MMLVSAMDITRGGGRREEESSPPPSRHSMHSPSIGLGVCLERLDRALLYFLGQGIICRGGRAGRARETATAVRAARRDVLLQGPQVRAIDVV